MNNKILAYKDFRHIRNVYLNAAQVYAEDAGIQLKYILISTWNSEAIDKQLQKLQYAIDQLSQAKALAALQYSVGRNPSGEGNENFDYDQKE